MQEIQQPVPEAVPLVDRAKLCLLIKNDLDLFAKGTFRKDVSAPQLRRFVTLCFEAVTLEEIFKLVDLYQHLYRGYVTSVKTVYNSTIGWAMPSQKACSLMYSTWSAHVEKYPGARFIDVGAGTGIFSYVMSLHGVPREKIVALDLENPTHRMYGQRRFWQCVTAVDIAPTDMLFVGWGSDTDDIIDDYVNSGGHCIVILGETAGGCTFPSDYVIRHCLSECEDCAKAEDDHIDSGPSDSEMECVGWFGERLCREIKCERLGWSSKMHQVPGASSFVCEYISINVRE